MSKWLGPGVLRIKKGKELLVVKPGEDFDKNLMDESRHNELLEKGFIEGTKSRAPKGSKE